MRHTVLIVEDDVDSSGSMKDVLEDEGYAVVCAPNGRRALDLLDDVEHVCLVLLDLLMPVMNGWDFLRELRTREDHGKAPVIVVTSAPANAPKDVVGVMAKPLDLDEILGAAERLCSKA